MQAALSNANTAVLRAQVTNRKVPEYNKQENSLSNKYLYIKLLLNILLNMIIRNMSLFS